MAGQPQPAEQPGRVHEVPPPAGRGLPGGRLWVELGAVTEDALVAATVAVHLGVPPGADDASEAVAGHLAALGRTLLVLDGCDTALDGAASLVSALLGQCPQLTVAVTSRVPLQLDTETVLALDPLPQPAGPAALGSSPLARLLTDRVRDGGGDIEFDADAAPHIVTLLHRCGGLPLAVELVAAQLASIPAGDLVDQLDSLLAGSDDPLRAVARGSYALLDEHEAAVFRRFAVLAGSAGLTLVRQVVSGDAILPVRVVRILRELTASGLLGVDRAGPRWRYHQEDDLRRFAGELLVECGEERAAYGRLADAILAVLPADAREPPAPFTAAITDMLGSLRSLLRAGLSGRADSGRCLELAFRLHRYWAATNVAEGRFWLARLLAAQPDAEWSPYATYALGYLDYWSGDTGNAIRELQTVVSLFAGVDDPYAARALIYLAGLLDDHDRGTEAGYAARAIELCQAGGSAEQLAAALPTAAMVCWQVGARDQARAFVDEAGPVLGGARRIARVVLLSVSAALALDDGDLAAAVDFGSAADREGTELGVEREVPLIRAVLARALLAAGDVAGAAGRARAAVEAALGMSFAFPLAIGLETASLVLHEAGAGSGTELARLLDAAAFIRSRGDRPPPATLRREIRVLRSGLAAAGAEPRAGTGDDDTGAGQLALELLARIGPASA